MPSPIARSIMTGGRMESMRRTIPIAIALAVSILTAADPPQTEISSGTLHAKLYLPDAANGYYRATRFDWSGVIASLEFQGHSFFGVWFPRYDPKLHDAITGPVEEYRTGVSALGYDDAKVGGTFIRIGVGLLKKPDDTPFQQFKTYDIVDNGKWTVKASADAVEFTQELADPVSGYAYLYKKTVRLAKDAPRLIIDHSLKNTGTKTIETNVYNHGFFVIDGQPSGPDFTVKFPFDVKAVADLQGLAETSGKELHYLRELQPGGQSVHSQLTGFGGSSRDFDFRVENRKTGAGVHVAGDRPLWKIDFWSIRTTVCPEEYIEMKIEPGKESQWRIAYDFYVLPPAR
jgi:hypothetical protein